MLLILYGSTAEMGHKSRDYLVNEVADYYVHGFQFFICQMPSQTVATENLQKPMTTNKTVMCSNFSEKLQRQDYTLSISVNPEQPSFNKQSRTNFLLSTLILLECLEGAIIVLACII